MLDVLDLEHIAYLTVVFAVALERIVELFVSNRNAQSAFDQGGKEYGQGHFGFMKVMHTLFLIACPAEVLLLDRNPEPWLWVPMFLVVLGTMSLRYWAIGTLGSRWNTRVIVVPGLQAVSEGPYKYMRHPNYVAVVLELIALPLMGGAWITALVFSVVNLALLKVRIDCEEAALAEHCGYDALSDRPRILP